MAKKSEALSVIALEIEKYEAKIKEFQDYLEFNNLLHKSFEEDKDKHKEIDVQIKMMSALPTWLLALKKLKEDSETSEMETRGDVPINDAYRHLKGNKGS